MRITFGNAKSIQAFFDKNVHTYTRHRAGCVDAGMLDEQILIILYFLLYLRLQSPRMDS